MMQNRQTIYFRIGSFVITGLILIVIAILVLGSGVLFKRVIYTETYFKESIQGLAEGSPVKYLGMDIGTVSEINTVSNIYPREDASAKIHYPRYIYVKMALSPKFFNNAPDDKIGDIVNNYVSRGLRIKMALQGLTGNAYLELDFVNPEDNPPLPTHWEPESYYIPSIPSTLTYFTENAQYILSELRKVNFKKTFDDADTMINSANDVMKHTSSVLSQNDRQIKEIVSNLRNTSENLDAVSERVKMHPAGVLFGNPPPRLDPSKL
jgi:phospholipid/cholesterol/gamma-HCH transport system substrate-binding protein/paraquat-inducible protein B